MNHIKPLVHRKPMASATTTEKALSSCPPKMRACLAFGYPGDQLFGNNFVSKVTPRVPDQSAKRRVVFALTNASIPKPNLPMTKEESEYANGWRFETISKTCFVYLERTRTKHVERLAMFVMVEDHQSLLPRRKMCLIVLPHLP